MFFIAEPNLLYLFIWALEIADTLIFDPDSDSSLVAILDRDNPVFEAVNGDNIISVPLHKQLFPCVNIPSNDDAASSLVHKVLFEYYIGVVKRGKRKN